MLSLPEPGVPISRRTVLRTALAGAIAPTAWAQSTPAAEVATLSVVRTEDGMIVEASVRIALPAAVEAALLKGVALYFLTELNLFRDRWYWRDKRAAYARKSARLSYQALTRKYRVSTGDGTLSQGFERLEDALAVIGRTGRWRVLEAAETEPEERYYAEFAFQLDLTQLPRPFQIGGSQSEWAIEASRTQRAFMGPRGAATAKPPTPSPTAPPPASPAAASAVSAPAAEAK